MRAWNMAWRLAAAIAIGWVVSFNARAGTVSYPASGHLDLREGTIELWFTIDTEADAPVATGLAFFHFGVPDHFTFSSSWNAGNRRLLARPSEAQPVGRNRMLGNIWSTTDLYGGRDYHLAFTWQGRDMALYLNGELIRRRTQAIPFTGWLARTRVEVGNRQRHTPLVARAFRISDVARPQEALAAARPVADIHTTLLDLYNDPGVADEGRTYPRVESGPGDERGGRFSGTVRYVTDPVTGLRL